MKKVWMVGWMILSISIYSVAQTRQITVESDKALNNDFSKYKTFTFASMIDKELEVGFYFLNDWVLKSQIREAVKDELTGLGYEFSTKDPDLVVNFRVFEMPTTLKGSEGYGTNYWGGAKYRVISDTISYDVKAGTLLISFADSKLSSVVWQGFASGLIDHNEFIKDKGNIREAVNLIIDEYGQRAKQYTRQ